jgi:hypothetical protein
MVELESDGEMTRSEVAAFLREFAHELDNGDLEGNRETLREDHGETSGNERMRDPKRMTFIVGGDSATVVVPDTLNFEVEVESRSPMFGSGVSQEIELDLSWQVEQHDDDLAKDQIEIE